MTISKVQVSQIGLSKKDQMLFRNLCRLSATAMGQFQLLPSEENLNGDILLIDADVLGSREELNSLATKKDFRSIVCLRNKETTPPDWLPTALVIKRPLVLRKITQTFEKLTGEERIESNTVPATVSILVVDDALPVRTFMKQKLHDILLRDVAIDAVTCGEEALIQMTQKNYQLIFLDVVMPDIDGYQVCRQMKSKYKVPVVMLTSHGSTLNKVKAKMCGCNGYITKPPRDKDLINEFKRHLPHALESDFPIKVQIV